MTKGKQSDQPLSRRDFMKLSATYGLTAVIGARALLKEAGASETKDAMEKNAKDISEKRSKQRPEVKIRMGVSGDSQQVQKRGFPTGYWEFARDLEERTDGRIQVQLIGSNALCTELTCARRFSVGAIPAFGSSSQNAAQTYPFLGAVDFPFLFPSRASMYHFLYSKEGDKVFRQVLRDKFDYEYLWALAEGRGVFLGLGWEDESRARTPEDIRNAKIRVTGSPMGRIALDLAGANPVPLDWAETFEGLKSGVVDGMENFPSAAPAYGMTPAISQLVHVELFAGFEHAAIRRSFLDELPDDLRSAVMESAYHTQQWTQQQHEKALIRVTGLTENPPKGTIFNEAGIRVNILTQEEKKQWVEAASPQNHPDAYSDLREKMMEIADGVDVYDKVYDIAREIPADTPADEVPPQRWWT
ncbi:TRAP transporter substrate-binding protein DctP [Ectothiorhodospiraceae bacterium WFHF3C12]|nr:TRAP transporter substrate-binding protein DctP [Ectothiorhodospiraceae bacterium WFHF3C12]